MNRTRAWSDTHDAIRARLSANQIRYTGGRQAVIRALQRATGPQSASELHRRLRNVPLSSIYRTLTVLDEAGVLQKHHDAGGLARFELAEWLAGHHHHVVCRECGAVEDVELSSDAERILDELAGGLGRQAGYRVDGHVLEVEGSCGVCR